MSEALAVVLIGELTVRYYDDRVVVEGPPGTEMVDLEPDPDAIRRHIKLDARGRFRPLSGLRGLVGGWRAVCATLVEADAVIEAVYPLALEHLSSHETRMLRVVSLEAALDRHSGRYASAASLDSGGRELATRILCGACVRAPIWAGRGAGECQIPCPEACSMLIAFCREAAIWQGDPPSRHEPDAEAPLAAFDRPGNPFREAYLARRDHQP